MSVRQTTGKTPITVAYGDGIGPEIMKATLSVLEAAGAQLEIETIDIGEHVYKEGFSAGIKPEAWESLRRTQVFLKAPITTPPGGGYKSLNVTIRKSLGLYANVRPCVSYSPFVTTRHPSMDVVIVRENEEDLYAGIEHRQTDEVTQCLKLISRPGCEKIIRYAFEYAKANNRRQVTCIVKDNIMKITDGLFFTVFEEIAADYPDIETDRMIVDIGAARLADTPELFDVMVMPNLYGDVLSDIAAQLTGSVGLGGSSNIGEQCAMFEAIHGSAPPIAGKNIANPSGLLLSSVMMLVHIGQAEVAERVHNAWLKTIEDGVHTVDIYREGAASTMRAGTEEFAQAVIERLGEAPHRLPAASYEASERLSVPKGKPVEPSRKELVGVDVFIDWREENRQPDALAKRLQEQSGELSLQMITNRGVKVWPEGMAETFCTDHWRCRFVAENSTVTHQQVVALLGRLAEVGLDFIKTEHLCTFDGKPGFSLGQGQ